MKISIHLFTLPRWFALPAASATVLGGILVGAPSFYILLASHRHQSNLVGVMVKKPKPSHLADKYEIKADAAIAKAEALIPRPSKSRKKGRLIGFSPKP